jgi:putative RNA 2'-phosphotransferase
MPGRADALDAEFLKRVSKQMALLLRHAPDRAGLILDPEGFVRTEDLVGALQSAIPEVDEAVVHAVVELVEPHKQRYSIVDDCVRANYGHSTAGRIEHAPAIPPDVLFHGTSIGTMPMILENGLRPMGRQYVHLTPDRKLAASVGARHGRPCLIRVDSGSAHAAGVVFFKANFTFWLAVAVPPLYLCADDDGLSAPGSR